MKTIVIYTSQTGFTKRYAEWISEASGAECVDFKQAKKIKLSDFDAIIFGGWFMAGGIKNLAWFKKQLPSLSAAGKKIIVYGVGGSPADSPDIPAAMRRNFTDEEWNSLKTFYCPGGFNYEKMSGFSKFMMKMFTTMLANKKDASEAEKNMAQMISHSYDISDKKYIEPILAELR
ncbi:flavodoxin domain-containing protein [Treponema bryantii]|uniref:flavodoxin domain-containing protein n=1 Tax=Treponema bryantii TaxID=163 RepID=UPI0003B3BF9B|nr:flavodoxin domain-containing protein [Treponema bryantii]